MHVLRTLWTDRGLAEADSITNPGYPDCLIPGKGGEPGTESCVRPIASTHGTVEPLHSRPAAVMAPLVGSPTLLAPHPQSDSIDHSPGLSTSRMEPESHNLHRQASAAVAWLRA